MKNLINLLTTTLFVISGAVLAQSQPETRAFEEIRSAANGQEVFFNAWGGDEKINAYIRWAGDKVEALNGVKVTHVKLDDTANAVAAVRADSVAGRDEEGRIDLIWINGENFKAMKEEGLLFGPFVEQLPNFAKVDTVGKPTTLVDFTVPVEGLEAPWGMAQFNFIYDSERTPEPFDSAEELLAEIKSSPGRFTYPSPPDFTGTTFLKQLLLELADDPAPLSLPVGEADFDTVTAPLWDYLDELHPHLWRKGNSFAASSTALERLMEDGEIDYIMTFTPARVHALKSSGQLPETAEAKGLAGGTIANTHFLAIPYNATAREGAMVLANFMMSPEAQAEKLKPEVFGDATVLNLKVLTDEERAFFDAVPKDALPDLGPTRGEPDASWVGALESAWLKRYSR